MPDFPNEAALLAADVVMLEADNARLRQENRIFGEMLSEALDIAHRSIAYTVTLTQLVKR